jgi:alpha-amylase/alpha-mannosidase (GH57 family)
MDRYVCIHGHFYQPPRENPWLEEIELQYSAHPYHDWNERITDECYAPNASSRILTGDGKIKEIVNNYAKISFNFGPTLLDWMENNEPEVYQAIIDADRESHTLFSGHGSALAQCYNHMIMPLANTRDKYTQVIWGIRDFQHRFGRRPEGMWLPETAVDLETLQIMAEHGILFVILTPYQAKRFRRIGQEGWHNVGPKGIDPSMPYKLNLPASGLSMSVFFYDGPISQAVAFEKLLSNGERFARRLLDGFDERRIGPQLVNISTDGETYGHHHRYGEMALSYALHYIESNNLAQITNYGEYLEKHPPTHEVEIVENSSWSCAHGVERWRSNCGCNSGMSPGWGQEWRTPLRSALNKLRNTFAPRFEEKARRFLKDPWKARDDYISVILDRSPENLKSFLKKHSTTELERKDQVTVLKLLELQRHAMLMYTSCGWFFDDISGIETVQILQYAGRVIQLGEQLFDISFEQNFLEILENAKSNVPEHRNGAHLYKKYVKPSIVDLPKVGAHYAISSLFTDYGEQSIIYCYLVEQEDSRYFEAGNTKLAVGRVKVTSQVTRDWKTLSYGVLFFGYHNVNGGVREFRDQDAYREMVEGVADAFERGDLTGVMRLLDRHFEGMTYSVRQLFGDQQRKIMEVILDSTLDQVTAEFKQIYDRHAPLMRFLKDLQIPRPKALHTAAEFVLNNGLRRALKREEPDFERIKYYLNEVRRLEVALDEAELGYTLKHTVEQIAERLKERPGDITLLQNLDRVMSLVRSLPFEVDMWKVQNIYYRLLNEDYPVFKEKARQADDTAQAWIHYFSNLGDKLEMRGGI